MPRLSSPYSGPEVGSIGAGVEARLDWGVFTAEAGALGRTLLPLPLPPLPVRLPLVCGRCCGALPLKEEVEEAKGL